MGKSWRVLRGLGVVAVADLIQHAGDEDGARSIVAVVVVIQSWPYMFITDFSISDLSAVADGFSWTLRVKFINASSTPTYIHAKTEFDHKTKLETLISSETWCLKKLTSTRNMH